MTLDGQSALTFSGGEVELAEAAPLASVFDLHGRFVVGGGAEVDDRVAQSVVASSGLDGSGGLFDVNPLVSDPSNSIHTLR